ncbi:MAG TPA: pitrilysin family protein [Burkholderiales bacterium]|nr:pitrilysin family protein [Burkholderiales bacterium]
MSRRFLLVSRCLLVSLALAAGCAAANPYERTLANGLRVIVKEDSRAPTVAHLVWYRVGSMDETNGITGIAHVLEHLMFKGTKTVAPGEFSRRVAAAGGRENAFTGRDYTVYFQQVERSRLPLMMQLEADRMANLVVIPDEFAREIKVVQEERRLRTNDRPRALVHETLMATAFQVHPYRRPIVGWMTDLESMTAADVRDWYARWYAPNNAFLVVVGDVSAESVFRLAETHYGALPGRPLPARKPQDEPAQAGARRVVVKAPAELPYLLMAYKAPVLRDVAKDREPYALAVLAAVLDGNDSARLQRRLVREQRIANEAGASYEAYARGPGVLLLEGVPAQGRTVAELEAALRAEVVAIANEGVTRPELERAKIQFVAGQVYKRDSIFAQALELGMLESAGLSFGDADRILEQVRAVTADEVRAAARRYLVEDGLTVATLEPLPMDRGPPRVRSGAGRH